MNETLNNQEKAIVELRDDITNMMGTVLKQLERAKDALVDLDTDVANEIHHIEKRVNAIELTIDKKCENILALYSPVATDLRFILATLSINTQLERIADHADGIAEYIIGNKIDSPYKEDILKEVDYDNMFETAISMVNDAIYSFINEDTVTAKYVFGKDATLNIINSKTSSIIQTYITKHPQQISKYLYLFSIMKKLERIGDLAKNIAEETIFFVDAKYVKHRDKLEKRLKK